MSPLAASLLVLAAELRKDLEAADAKVRELSPFADAAANGPEVYIPAAIMHHLYTAIESMFERIFATFEGKLRDAADSHARILKQAQLEIASTRPAIISSVEYELLDELREFRHLFRHGYGIALKPDRLQELAAMTVARWPGAKAKLQQFLDFVDACAAKAQ